MGIIIDFLKDVADTFTELGKSIVSDPDFITLLKLCLLFAVYCGLIWLGQRLAEKTYVVKRSRRSGRYRVFSNPDIRRANAVICIVSLVAGLIGMVWFCGKFSHGFVTLSVLDAFWCLLIPGFGTFALKSIIEEVEDTAWRNCQDNAALENSILEILDECNLEPDSEEGQALSAVIINIADYQRRA